MHMPSHTAHPHWSFGASSPSADRAGVSIVAVVTVIGINTLALKGVEMISFAACVAQAAFDEIECKNTVIYHI